MCIFAIFNIQKKLNEGYQNFGQVISKTLAIESVQLTKNLPEDKVKETLKEHSDSILKSHNDIVFIEFRDKNGRLIYSGKHETPSTKGKPNITVTSPLLAENDNESVGSVTVGLSGNCDAMDGARQGEEAFYFLTPGQAILFFPNLFVFG